MLGAGSERGADGGLRARVGLEMCFLNPGGGKDEDVEWFV